MNGEGRWCRSTHEGFLCALPKGHAGWCTADGGLGGSYHWEHTCCLGGLQADLDELKATDRIVKAAAESYEFRARVDNGWVPFGWHLAYPTVRLEFDGTDECGNPVWERNAAWGLSVTEQEADRNARGCGACTVCQPDWRGMYVCATCGNKRCPHATDCRHACTGSNERGGSMLGFADDLPNPTIRETVRGIRDAITGARPCCHTTGPNHHPACQEKP